MKKFLVNELPNEIKVSGKFDDSCFVSLSEEKLKAIKNRKLNVSLKGAGKAPFISQFEAVLSNDQGNVYIIVGGPNCTLSIQENCRGTFRLMLLGRQSKISIGKSTTSNGVRIYTNNSEFICGEDCMFSNQILIQATDEHGIIDLESSSIINNKLKTVTLGDHVWLGRQSSIVSSVTIGSGSIAGACSIVTKDIPPNCIAVGYPARVIKEKHTWCRRTDVIEEPSLRYIESIDPSLLCSGDVLES